MEELRYDIRVTLYKSRDIHNTLKQKLTSMQKIYPKGKIEKVPRGIQGEKSSKTWQVRGIWSQRLEHKQVPKGGRNQVFGRVKRSILASHTRC